MPLMLLQQPVGQQAAGRAGTDDDVVEGEGGVGRGWHPGLSGGWGTVDCAPRFASLARRFAPQRAARSHGGCTGRRAHLVCWHRQAFGTSR